MMGGAKGTPLVYWYSAVSSAFRNVGYLVGYLTGCFSRFRSCPRSRRMPCGEPASLLSSMLFFRRGQGDPALRRAFPACGRPPGEAVA